LKKITIPISILAIILAGCNLPGIGGDVHLVSVEVQLAP
jgi:predicted small secreted protein